MTIKVKLRKKPISGNRESLFLDFWPSIKNPKTGEPTRREFLKMYLYTPLKAKKKNGKTPIYGKNPLLNGTYKKHNLDTLAIAEGIRQKRENELNKPEIYTEFEKERIQKQELGNRDFIQYYKELSHKHTGSVFFNWDAAGLYLQQFAGNNLKVSDINEKFCNDFKEYLINAYGFVKKKKALEQNTAGNYFSKFKAALKQAYKDGLLYEDLNTKIASIKKAETRKNYLTIGELNTLVKTDCPSPVIKRAALFSALTGMRFSDIMKLIWGEIELIEGTGYVINFRQKKTKGIEILPISEQAFGLLGERKEPADRVFEGLEYSAYYNKFLYQWIGAAGITKPITFHCFRHTFATLQLSKGTDIYTVSKMLGHRSLQATQIYAKVVDKLKRDAANRIELDM